MHETPAPDTSKHATLAVSLQAVASGVHALDIKQGVPWISQMCRWHLRRPQSCTFSNDTTASSMVHPTSTERDRSRYPPLLLSS